MLTHLSIQNFTLVQQLDLEIDAGMTVITGETGAGKSILLGALGQALGDRADGDRVRNGAERADIHATFDIRALKHAQRWLKQQDLEAAGTDECLLRRVITTEGRSRAYINGQPVTLTQLRTLGEMLIDIHSQHEHQSLLKKDTHRRLLDDFGGQQKLAQQVKQAFTDWQTRYEQFIVLRDNAAELSARLQLLSYQVNELDQLALEPDELPRLEAEQKTLANAESILHNSHQLATLCGQEDQGLQDALHRALHLLNDMPEKTAALREAEELLTSAQIQVQEAQREIEQHIDSFQLDPERLQQVEARLSAVYDIARKHRIHPDELLQLHQTLTEELARLSGGDAQLDQLEQQTAELETRYRDLATNLSGKRQRAAKRLSKAVNQQLQALAMSTAKLDIALTGNQNPGRHGLEDIEFLISTNPGQPPRSLAKVASGGELSRISLAIQVVTAQTSTIPTLVFDEVDVGIGGATADTVGQLLRALGEKGQVLCVTHLAQVASKGHQHLQVTKQANKKSAQSSLVALEGEAKIEEIARMLGGAGITEQSRAHAEEMLAGS